MNLKNIHPVSFNRSYFHNYKDVNNHLNLRKLAIHRALDASVEAKDVIFDNNLIDIYYELSNTLMDLSIYEFASCFKISYKRINGRKSLEVKFLISSVEHRIVVFNILLSKKDDKNSKIVFFRLFWPHSRADWELLSTNQLVLIKFENTRRLNLRIGILRSVFSFTRMQLTPR
jgi:hypothetical protein